MENKKRYNTLLLTVDDLNYDTLGCFGSPVEGVSPNLDALCEEGIKFENSFVTIAVCQPSRCAMVTGRYPHRNGAKGFEAIDSSCTTMTERLAQHGYYNGIIGKEDHLAPKFKFAWDYYIQTYNPEHAYGRNPQNYYDYTTEFLKQAKEAGKPFFLMANSHDPHRPFVGSKQEMKMFGTHYPCDHVYKPEEVDVKGCHPDLPIIREEMAQYYSSVRRGDQTIGRILDALKESGEYDNTLILFLSDNGMALPFCKTNCYYNSTRSPYIMKLPKDMQENQVKVCDTLVNGIDITPTFLDIMGVEGIDDIDGKSFKECLYDNSDIHEDIFTQFYKTSINPQTGEPGYYPMRSVTSKKYVYIFNGWSDGETEFRNESMSGLTFDAMKEAALTDPDVKARVDLFLLRKVEELYDVENDNSCLVDLMDKPEYAQLVDEMRNKMHEYMVQSQDGFLDKYNKEIMILIK